MSSPSNGIESGGIDTGGAAAPPVPPPLPLLDSLLALVSEIPGLISDRVQLLSLELKRASLAMARIVLLLVATAVLGVTAWIAMWGVVVGALMALGLHWAVALLAVLLINMAAVVWAIARMRGLASYLQLPATLRHLTLRTAPPSSSEASAHVHTSPREAPAA